MLQFITHPSENMTILEEIENVVAGGCKWVQLRMKDADKEEIKAVARKAKEICKKNDVILVIDDYADIAKELELDGVHLGKKDMPVDEARKLLGEEFIIGATANSFEDIEALRHTDIDYIGLGPFRFTSTKKNLSPVIGIEGYAEIMRRKAESSINIPIVAIGGICYDDINDIMDTGINGIAVSGSLINAENMTEETKRMISLLESIIDKRLNF
ncbi:MAG: thiamine phosphate synthase [Bacteroidetes bacterium]|uniref:Thiamine-phosphate synthase n=1 Tax=Candidatus Limisoma faecipullorum TaxID=2840854 RepID=A0A9D9IS69_9BACT|nr:thiamine phosphate synthase [Candidatus Limisoma faecipullorum]